MSTECSRIPILSKLGKSLRMMYDKEEEPNNYSAARHRKRSSQEIYGEPSNKRQKTLIASADEEDLQNKYLVSEILAINCRRWNLDVDEELERCVLDGITKAVEAAARRQEDIKQKEMLDYKECKLRRLDVELLGRKLELEQKEEQLDSKEEVINRKVRNLKRTKKELFNQQRSLDETRQRLKRTKAELSNQQRTLDEKKRILKRMKATLIDQQRRLDDKGEKLNDRIAEVEDLKLDLARIKEGLEHNQNFSQNEAESCERNTNNKQDFQDVQNSLLCCVCHQLLIKATTSNCSHSFCQLCIIQSMTHRQTCPFCRAEIKWLSTSVTIDATVDSVIKLLPSEEQRYHQSVVAERERESAKQQISPEIAAKFSEHSSVQSTDAVDSSSGLHHYGSPYYITVDSDDSYDGYYERDYLSDNEENSDVLSESSEYFSENSEDVRERFNREHSALVNRTLIIRIPHVNI